MGLPARRHPDRKQCRLAAEHNLNPGASCHMAEQIQQGPDYTSNCQGSFVYPYPSVSALAGGNSDHGPRKARLKTQTTPDSVFIG